MNSIGCPKCGDGDSFTILYGAATIEMQRQVQEGRAVAAAPAQNNGPDRQCRACGERFYTDASAQAKNEADAARQRSRVEAMKRGDYRIFTAGQSSETIATELLARDAQRRKEPKNDPT